MTDVPEPDTGLDAHLDRLLESAPTSQTGQTPDSRALPRLTALLAASLAAPEPGPQPGELAALAAFRELVTEPAGTPSLAGRRRRQLTLAAAIGSAAVVLGGGVAAAATGSLPGVAQSTAKSMLGVIGVHVPGPNAHAGTHPQQRGSSGDFRDHGKPAAHPTHPTHPAAPVHPTHPVHPTTPAGVGTPRTPGNSGVSRHHGNPTPTATSHPTPGHGKPTAAPTTSHRHTAPPSTKPVKPRVTHSTSSTITH